MSDERKKSSLTDLVARLRWKGSDPLRPTPEVPAEQRRSRFQRMGGRLYEVVDRYEIYRLDPTTEARERRICGRKLAVNGRLCEEHAGAHTDHIGFGRCRAHDQSMAGRNTQKREWLRRVIRHGRETGTLMKFYDHYRDWEAEDFEDMTELLRYEHAYLEYLIDRAGQEPEMRAKYHKWILEVEKEIRRTVVASSRVRSGYVFDVGALAPVFAQIVGIVQQVFDEQAAEKVFRRLMEVSLVGRTGSASQRELLTRALSEVKYAEVITDAVVEGEEEEEGREEE